MTGPTLHLLLGPPGTGKLTVGTELVRLLEADGEVARLVDNHGAADLLFPFVPEADGTSPLPPRLGDLLREVNLAVLHTIDELSPPSWSFVFTHHLTPTEANRSYVEQLRDLAHRRGAAFVVVVLRCQLDELGRRVVQPERHGRKLVDPDAARAMALAASLEPADAHHLDVTALPPSAAALAIRALGTHAGAVGP